jgi:hypothetical protein
MSPVDRIRTEMTQAEQQFRERERRIRRRARETIAMAFVALAVLIAITWARSYVSGETVSDAQRQGCERNTLDKMDFAGFMFAAADARRAQGDNSIATDYQRRAEAITGRTGVPRDATPRQIHNICYSRYPKPNIFGF